MSLGVGSGKDQSPTPPFPFLNSPINVEGVGDDPCAFLATPVPVV